MYSTLCNISLCHSGRDFLKSVGVLPLPSEVFGTGPSNCLGWVVLGFWHEIGPFRVAVNEYCKGKILGSPVLRRHLMCCSCTQMCWSKQVGPAAQCLFAYISAEFTSAQEIVQRMWLWKLDSRKEWPTLLSKGCFGASYYSGSRDIP